MRGTWCGGFEGCGGGGSDGQRRAEMQPGAAGRGFNNRWPSAALVLGARVSQRRARPAQHAHHFLNSISQLSMTEVGTTTRCGPQSPLQRGERAQGRGRRGVRGKRGSLAGKRWHATAVRCRSHCLHVHCCQPRARIHFQALAGVGPATHRSQARWASSAMVWIVLPSPISSARMPAGARGRGRESMSLQ